VLHLLNDILVLLSVLAVCGAVADWQYVRKGGVRSGKRDRILVWTLAALFLGIVIFYGYSLGRIGVPEESVAASCGELTSLFFFLVFIAYEFLRWRVREKHPIIADGPKYRGVGGWLLLFIIYVTIVKPVWVGYLAFLSGTSIEASQTLGLSLVQITWPVRIVILLFGIYSGVALWRVQRGAVRIARAYLLAVILQQGLELALGRWSFLSQFDVLKLWRFIVFTIVMPIGFALIWYFYFKRSERVAATYPDQ
jgi:hypothetical protein